MRELAIAFGAASVAAEAGRPLIALLLLDARRRVHRRRDAHAIPRRVPPRGHVSTLPPTPPAARLRRGQPSRAARACGARSCAAVAHLRSGGPRLLLIIVRCETPVKEAVLLDGAVGSLQKPGHFAGERRLAVSREGRTRGRGRKTGGGGGQARVYAWHHSSSGSMVARRAVSAWQAQATAPTPHVVPHGRRRTVRREAKPRSRRGRWRRWRMRGGRRPRRRRRRHHGRWWW